ncbi:hypothetical protein BDW59DRAFT_158609 [Aspergillus cavernicola]|uniref:Shikimate dehydrogenase substrate binding N-terminal domain-containing protein n=1 Tax=Aspergillus cavernicola TaxID=176166 RepID=A0ABR4IR90_9EURO
MKTASDSTPGMKRLQSHDQCFENNQIQHVSIRISKEDPPFGVTHSIAPGMHNHIAASLSLPWTFYSTEYPTIDDVLALAKDPTTAGLVVTMPYKNAIMEHLDRLDELATMIGACINGCLREKGNAADRPTATNPGSALIVGAGGASRAAVYALSEHLHCRTCYILNRDEGEVRNLVRDAQNLRAVPAIIHVKTIDQAKKLSSPYYIVGTVPDFEP